MKHALFRIFAVVVLTLSCAVVALAADADIDQQRNCPHCGMDRKAYGYSRMLVEYKDGKQVGTCSLHCLVTELNSHKGAEVASYKVADRNTRQLIDAEQAVWTIGGKKRGVMSQRATWAFATKAAAQNFIEANGGKIATWNAVLAATRADTQIKPR